MHDFRSDTVTRPTPAMLQAMMAAPVGDDVLRDDPSVLKLEAEVCALLGKEASVFVPSGTMANQLAIRAHTEPGDEIIAQDHSHIYEYEGGAPAALAGCSLRLIHAPSGLFGAEDVSRAMRPAHDEHCPRSRLLVVENTHNRGGGRIWPLAQLQTVTARAREHGLRCHMDGARLMNACVASGVSAREYASHVDSVSMCFSKGLGAPVGSVLAGDAPTIARARRFRKMYGGAMRQCGYLAAAASYALSHHIDRLAEDHANARTLAEEIAGLDGFEVDVASVETNIVYFEVSDRLAEKVGGAAGVCRLLLERSNVALLDLGPRTLRAVTHLDVGREDVAAALAALSSLSPPRPTGARPARPSGAAT